MVEQRASPARNRRSIRRARRGRSGEEGGTAAGARTVASLVLVLVLLLVARRGETARGPCCSALLWLCPTVGRTGREGGSCRRFDLFVVSGLV